LREDRKKTIRIMLDMDGVVADFTSEVLSRANRMFGIAIPDKVTTWGFEEAGIGITAEMLGDIYGDIKATPNFYEGQEPLLTDGEATMLRQLTESSQFDVYMITARFPVQGRSVVHQCQNWVRRHIGPGFSVIVKRDKGTLCRALGIDYVLEDSPVYLDGIIKAGTNRAYLIDRPYNRDFSICPRVKSIEEFVDIVISETEGSMERETGHGHL